MFSEFLLHLIPYTDKQTTSGAKMDLFQFCEHHENMPI